MGKVQITMLAGRRTMYYQKRKCRSPLHPEDKNILIYSKPGSTFVQDLMKKYANKKFNPKTQSK